MSRGYGSYERAILATLIAPWVKKREKCRCPRCIEVKVVFRIVGADLGLPLDAVDLDNVRRSFRRAFNSLLRKGVIVVCDSCGTVQLWNDPRAHKDGHGATEA